MSNGEWYISVYLQINSNVVFGKGIVSLDGTPRGALPSGILKLDRYCPGLGKR